VNEDAVITINGMWFAGAMATIIAVVLIVIILQVGAGLRARARLAREDAYRDLAERGTAAQAETAGDLQRLAVEVADVKDRIGSIERMMREIE
jgi:HAMP domain-containing protein